MAKKTYYYSDLLNDDFANNNIKTVLTPAEYQYLYSSWFLKVITFIFYHILVRPLVTIFIKLFYLQRFKNKKILKKYKKQGYFIYGNHTNTLGDAFIPSMTSFPKKNYIICNPDATSIKGIKNIVKMLGALPLPSSIRGNKNFLNAIKQLINTNNVITIYPEAHLWPYYTDIRPFKSVSFTYTYDLKVPCFSLTNIYVKRKFKLIKRPKIITYIDGPFYANYSLSKKDSIQQLRNAVYNSMKNNVNKHEKYEYISYVYQKKEE